VIDMRDDRHVAEAHDSMFLRDRDLAAPIAEMLPRNKGGAPFPR
jgi:hypothetical protein